MTLSIWSRAHSNSTTAARNHIVIAEASGQSVTSSRLPRHDPRTGLACGSRDFAREKTVVLLTKPRQTSRSVPSAFCPRIDREARIDQGRLSLQTGRSGRIRKSASVNDQRAKSWGNITVSLNSFRVTSTFSPGKQPKRLN